MTPKFILPILLGIFLAACATAPADDFQESSTISIDPHEMINNAQTLMREQKYAQASNSFTRILKVVDENEEAQAGLALAARLSGNPGEALKHYRQLEKYPARQTTALEGQGLALLQLRDWTGAERVLLLALTGDKTLWKAWNALGQARDRQHNWTGAEIAYQQAIALRPYQASLYNNQGVSYLCQMRLDEALAMFDHSLSLKSDVATVEGNRVLTLALKGKYQNAMLGVSWKHRQYGFNNIGFIALLNGDTSQADKFLIRAEEESPRYYQTAVENRQLLK